MGAVALYADQVRRELTTMDALGALVPRKAFDLTRDLAVIGPCAQSAYAVSKCAELLIERASVAFTENIG